MFLISIDLGLLNRMNLVHHSIPLWISLRVEKHSLLIRDYYINTLSFLSSQDLDFLSGLIQASLLTEIV